MKPIRSHGTTLAAAWMLLAGACVPPAGVQEELISERGGFPEPEMRLAPEAEGDYCAAEVMRWRYDEAAETLRFADARVLLGCCGQRRALIERVDSLIELTEVDEAEPGAGRCEGVCAFDIAVSAPAVPPGPLVLRLLRDVTDAQGGPVLVWQGELDLSQGAGAVTLDDTPAAGCREEP
jgi:hypothetical protein